MSNIDKQALRWKAEKATKGEWWSDSCSNEGTYGSGDDCVEGYTSYAVYDENNQILLDTLNSTAACINEEYDGECHVAWDEVGQRNAEFVAAANPATVLALLDELEAKDKLNAELMEKQRLIDICHGQGLEHRIAAEKRAEAAEKTVEMPTFDGYVPHVARELQAAFRIACDNAGINIAAAGKGE